MKDSLKVGVQHTHQFVVPQSKTVPALYPEAAEFVAMPDVFATGFLVGLLEWVCIKAINPYINWPIEQTVGTHINVSHQAATPVGSTITVKAELIAIESRKLIFSVEAHDGIDIISSGLHERFIINREKFDAKLASKKFNV
jgi:fluoroacetyl-CoA thioesterase